MVGFALMGAAYLAATYTVFWRTTQEARTGRVTIRIAQWQLELGVRDALTKIIERYEQLNPHVHVVQIAVPDRAYLPWVQTQMVGGNGPDIVEYSFPWPDTARNFQPIDADIREPNPYNRGTALEGVPWKDTFVDGMASPDNFVQSLNAYYSISMTTGVPRIAYNRALLKTITGSDAPPRTYRELLVVSDQIRAYAKEHQLNLVPLANSHPTHRVLTDGIVAVMGFHLYERLDLRHRLKIDPSDLGMSYLMGDWSYDSPELIAALKALKEYSEICTPSFLQRLRETALIDFVSNRAVMIVAPAFEAGSLRQIAPFPLGAFRFPFADENDPVYGRFAKGPVSEGQIVTGMPFYLNRHTRHRAEAVDFMRFMSSFEGSTIFTRLSNWLPVVIGVKPSEYAAQYMPDPKGYTWYGAFTDPCQHVDSREYIFTQMSALMNRDGSVDAYRAILRKGLGVRIRDDLRREVISGLQNLRHEDVAATALLKLAPNPGELEALRLATVTNETKIYQTRLVVAKETPAQ
ncbi:MAG: transporter substrate-binding protein [Verrucomicrobia bacterium]|nr:transporter substrate-binding protein [Verrucomicrobiota bacterium]